MKKRIFIFLACVGLLFLFLDRASKEVLSTFQEENEERYILNVASLHLRSHEIIEKLGNSSIRIYQVYPEIKLPMEDRVVERKLQMFYVTNWQQTEESIISILKEYGFYDLMDEINAKGFLVKGLSCDSTRTDMQKLLETYPEISIEYTDDMWLQ